MTYREIIKDYTLIANTLLGDILEADCLFWALTGYKLSAIKTAPPEVDIAAMMLEMDDIRNTYLRENYGWEI